MKQKFLLIDGHNFLFRGFYGVPVEAKHSDGTPINAVYGFFSLLRRVLESLNPEYLLIAFDSETSSDKKKSVRPEYKANRTLEHKGVYSQLPLIKNCLDIQGVTWEENPSMEADDVIGLYSTKAMHKDINVYIASNDFDFMQLVCSNIFVLRGYHGKVETFTSKNVSSKFGVLPAQYVDYLALKGDQSDNIKGVKGIGKKRAMHLISKYKTIEGIYRSFNSLPAIYQRMLAGKEKFLIRQKNFLEIKKYENYSSLNLKNYSFVNKTIADKMGSFLDRHWENIKNTT